MSTPQQNKRDRLAKLAQHLRCRYPIIQSPMGWIARATLASAVCKAGGLGMIETSSGEVDNCLAEIDQMHSWGIHNFAINIPLMLLHDPRMFDQLLQRKPYFVTTSAGSASKLLAPLKEVGAIVYHSVATLATACKAVAAGVDGLIVEGHEGGGFKNAAGVSSLVLVRAVRKSFPHIPIVAAGGVADGYTMAAVLVAGADAVQMGTRFVASQESPVHNNFKEAIKNSGCDNTLVVNQQGKPLMRVLDTPKARTLIDGPMDNETLMSIKNLYFKGDMQASVALAGQSAAMIVDLPTVATIINNIMNEARHALDAYANIELALDELLTNNCNINA